jgi:hypothetical protein
LAVAEWYTVEKILRKRVRDDQVEYLIKWEGYDLNASTWEPAEGIPAKEIRSWETVKRVSQPRWDRLSQITQKNDAARLPEKRQAQASDAWSDEEQEEEPSASFSNSTLAEKLGLQKKNAAPHGGKALLSASQSTFEKDPNPVKSGSPTSESDVEPLMRSQNKLRYSSASMYRSPLAKLDDAEDQEQKRSDHFEQLRAMSTRMDEDGLGQGNDSFATKIQSAMSTSVMSTSLPIPKNWGPNTAPTTAPRSQMAAAVDALPFATETPLNNRKSKSLTGSSASMPHTVAANDRTASKTMASEHDSQLLKKPRQKQQPKQPPRSPYRKPTTAPQLSNRSPYRSKGGAAASSSTSARDKSPVRNIAGVNRISQRSIKSPFRNRAGTSPYQKPAAAFPSPIKGLSLGFGFGSGGSSAAKRKALGGGSANKRAKPRAYSVGSDDEDNTAALFKRVKASPDIRKKQALQKSPAPDVMTERQKEALEEQQLPRTLF